MAETEDGGYGYEEAYDGDVAYQTNTTGYEAEYAGEYDETGEYIGTPGESYVEDENAAYYNEELHADEAALFNGVWFGEMISIF